MCTLNWSHLKFLYSFLRLVFQTCVLFISMTALSARKSCNFFFLFSLIYASVNVNVNSASAKSFNLILYSLRDEWEEIVIWRHYFCNAICALLFPSIVLRRFHNKKFWVLHSLMTGIANKGRLSCINYSFLLQCNHGNIETILCSITHSLFNMNFYKFNK